MHSPPQQGMVVVGNGKRRNEMNRGIIVVIAVFCAAVSVHCTKKSAGGESCSKTADCASSLKCIDLKCVDIKGEADKKCRQALECKKFGLCSSQDGKCIAASNADCEQSLLCQISRGAGSKDNCEAKNGECANSAMRPQKAQGFGAIKFSMSPERLENLNLGLACHYAGTPGCMWACCTLKDPSNCEYLAMGPELLMGEKPRTVEVVPGIKSWLQISAGFTEEGDNKTNCTRSESKVKGNVSRIFSVLAPTHKENEKQEWSQQTLLVLKKMYGKPTKVSTDADSTLWIWKQPAVELQLTSDGLLQVINPKA